MKPCASYPGTAQFVDFDPKVLQPTEPGKSALRHVRHMGPHRLTIHGTSYIQLVGWSGSSWSRQHSKTKRTTWHREPPCIGLSESLSATHVSHKSSQPTEKDARCQNTKNASLGLQAPSKKVFGGFGGSKYLLRKCLEP